VLFIDGSILQILEVLGARGSKHPKAMIRSCMEHSDRENLLFLNLG
jgi:hypothetical protein